MNISDMTVGTKLIGFYVLKSASRKVTAAGKPFLAAVLSDKSGSIEAKVWDYSGPVSSADEGKIVKIKGLVSEFKGALQINVDLIRLAVPEDGYDVSVLVPTAPISEENTVACVEKMIGDIQDEDYRAVCFEVFKKYREKFIKMPAAKSVHHAFLGGLLMHTCNMMKTAQFLLSIYGSFLDGSLLMAGTFLHDFAKIREFKTSELGLVTEYSVEGQLLGHLVMGAMEVGEVCKNLGISEEKAVLLQHMILSHHGEPEYGAAVKCQCAESELLSYIDMLDSRMEIYAETLEKTQKGEFSEKVFALDGRCIFNHGAGEEK